LGLNAATTRNGISSTMAHLISCNNGSRFVFSHEFLDLLVGQMEATSQELKKVIIRIYCIEKCLLDLDPIQF
jgi:hypothetical protein